MASFSGSSTYLELIDIFESAIIDADLTDLIIRLESVYDSTNKDEFELCFQQILKFILTEGKRPRDIKRLLYFISETAVKLDNSFKDKHARLSVENLDDLVHPLLKTLFDYLQKWSSASCYTVRARSCQLLHLILRRIQDDGIGEIDMDVYESISQIIDNRRLDESASVRCQAVLLAKFFQDPSSSNDPVIEGLLWQLQHDPNPLVRQNIANTIAACEESVIPIAERFLFDKSASVRNAALLHICNRITPRSFTTEQRIFILNQCFNDSSAKVRRTAQDTLIPVWFRAYKNNLCKFFSSLRIGNESLYSLNFIRDLAESVSKLLKVSQIFEEVGIDLETKLPQGSLSADKVFLWHHFYELSLRDVRLQSFIPESNVLIDFILKYFAEANVEEKQVAVFNELVVLLMEVLSVVGTDHCEGVFETAFDLIKNPFIPCGVMPYIVPLLVKFYPETETLHDKLCEIIEDFIKLLSFTLEDETNYKKMLVKCLTIANEVLASRTVLTLGIKRIKDNIILPYLGSEDDELKFKAITGLSSYCQLDIKEAKCSWHSVFANALHIESSGLKTTLLKCAFDILNCHGRNIFAELTNDGEDMLNKTLEAFLLDLEDDEDLIRITMLEMLKLFTNHHTSSPSVLSRVVLLYFHPVEDYYVKKIVADFITSYGQTANDMQVLKKAFLSIVAFLFESSKGSVYHKVNIRSVLSELLEFANQLEKSANINEEKFQDVLVLNVCQLFLKLPWKLPVSDLYSFCNLIIPKDVKALLELHGTVKAIISVLNSRSFEQKNPFTKRQAKQFPGYLKKIESHLSLDGTPQSARSKRPAADTESNASSTESNDLERDEDEQAQEDRTPDEGDDPEIGDASSSSSNDSSQDAYFTAAESPSRKTPARKKAVSKKYPPLVPEEQPDKTPGRLSALIPLEQLRTPISASFLTPAGPPFKTPSAVRDFPSKTPGTRGRRKN